MTKRQNISIFPLLIMGVFFLFASSCEKDDDNEPTIDNPTTGVTTAEFNPSVTYDTMTDQDGNVYKTVTIGTQTWMAENLRTTMYNDGITAIPNVPDGEALITGAYWNYNNTTVTDDIATYGRLYNWYAVNTGKLAPKGWHVPTDAEWTTLTNYLGDESVAGGKLKETGTIHWAGDNTGATNETGFTALPGGNRSADGTFESFGAFGFYWSATGSDASYASGWDAGYRYSNVYSNGYDKGFGFSVRCVKD